MDIYGIYSENPMRCHNKPVMSHSLGDPDILNTGRRRVYLTDSYARTLINTFLLGVDNFSPMG